MNYKTVYTKALGLTPGDYISSELSDRPAVDIHHIVNRENRIENLMAVTREEHLEYGDKVEPMAELLTIHRQFLDENRVEYDAGWFDRWINEYKHRGELKKELK